MTTGLDEYKQYLIKKLEVVQRINENSISQVHAIKIEDIRLLGKLSKRQQANVERLKHMHKPDLMLYLSPEDDTEIKELKNRINQFLNTTIMTSISNISGAEELKSKIGISIYRLKFSRNAMRNGYFKKSQQQYGYYIDKKIGK